MKAQGRATLLFDLRATQPRSSDVHGAASYARAVIDALCGTGRTDIVGIVDGSMRVDERLLQKVNSAGWSIEAIDGIKSLGQLVRGSGARRFFSALPYEYGGVDFGDIHFVATVHGLRTIEMPADAYAARFANTWGERLKCSARSLATRLYVKAKTREFERLLRLRARRRTFVVPSEFTKRSVLSRLGGGKAGEDLHVLYSPKTELASNPAARDFSPGSLDLRERRYILLVSADRWVKNTFRALMAIESALDQGADAWPVVVVGNLPKRFPSRWKHLFRVLGRCDNQTLAGLYANAGLFIYPTLNEGFGYPPIEAMSYGTPVLCSAISAVPEIAADGAAYFSPFDHLEIAARLATFVSDSVLRSELSAAGSRRYERVEQRQVRDLQRLCEILLEV